MLINWLQPSLVEPGESLLPMGLPDFGRQICRITNFTKPLSGAEVGLIGVEPETADAVREALYRLSPPAAPAKVFDLGNCRQQGDGLVIPLIQELLESNILPILIGGDSNLIRQHFLACQRIHSSTQVIVVDEQVRLHPEVGQPALFPLNTVLDKSVKGLYSLGLIGIQSHFTPQEVLAFLDRMRVEHVRLGVARAALEEIEPLVRDADMLSFHLQALRASEMPEQLHPSPNGFQAEEACRIARYAGLSDRLRSVSFPGFRLKRGSSQVGAQVVAQMIWYFLEGYFGRYGDFPRTSEGMTEYQVQSAVLEMPVIFWKSNRSGRWWMQVPIINKGQQEEAVRLVSCTYEDYLQSTRGDFPDRLVLAWNWEA